MLRNTKIDYRLYLAFSLILILMMILGFGAFKSMEVLADLTKNMYRHPLIVSNAVHDANTNIVSIHLSMKDVVLASSEAEISEAVYHMDQHEKVVLRNFQIVQERFLGDKAKVTRTLQAIHDWRQIRDEVISLVRAGQFDAAEIITKGKGATHLALIEMEMNELVVFAHNKAREYKDAAEKKYIHILSLMGFLLLLILLSSTVIAITITRNVKKEIKERRQTEENLGNTEKKIHLIMDSAGEGIYGLDLDGKTTFINPSAAHMVGWEPDELIGKAQHDIVHHTRLDGSPYPRLECPIYTAFKDGKVHHVVDEVFWRKDGTSFPVEYTSTPIREDGKLSGAVVVFMDVTEQKKTSEQLDISMEMLKIKNRITNIFVTVPDEEMYGDVLQIVLETMESPFGVFGYLDERGDLVVPSMTRNIWDQCQVPEKSVVFPRDTWSDSSWPRAINEKRTIYENTPSDGIPDGHIPISRHISMPVLNQGEVIGLFQVANKDTDYMEEDIDKLQVLANDIAPILDARLRKDREAERREATEQQLQQAQKMEAVGQLTGGVAHDFNNILAVIQGNLELLGVRLEDDAKDTHHIKKAMFNVKRGAQLTQRLLAFSRKQILDPAALDLNDLVRGMHDLLQRTLGETIEIETVCGGGLWRSFVDDAQVENVLLNLAINARDAMPEGGKLTIETANTRLDDNYAATHAEVVAGQYVMLAVTDTGTGIPDEVLAHIFEPFYTTKGAGKGTGLGMSMAYGFARQSGGHIAIYSEVGEGTTIKLYLPRDTGSDEVEGEKGAVTGDIPTGQQETVLVVEDEPDLLEIVVAQLEGLGYTVFSAKDGAMVPVIVENNEGINLLLTDVILTGEMNGRDVAEALQKQHPAIKVLYMSGYTENAIAHQGRLDGELKLLKKPFTRDELARKVKKVLDS